MRASEFITEGKRIPRKKGQPAGSKKHSDLYTDENPKEPYTDSSSLPLLMQKPV